MITPKLEPVFTPEPEIEEISASVEPEPLPEVDMEPKLRRETKGELEESVMSAVELELELEPGPKFEPERSPELKGEPEVKPEEVKVEHELEPEEPEMTPHISHELGPKEVPEEGVVQVDDLDTIVYTGSSSRPATSVHLSISHFPPLHLHPFL